MLSDANHSNISHLPSTMSPTTEPPWTHHLTLDTLILILSRSLFHPFITLLIPLSLRACAKPYDSPSMILSFIWSAAVITCHLLSALNTRLAYGPARELDWEEEVVVITGGRSGLGKVLAEMYGMRGASVAVLDLSVPAEGEVEGSEALAGVKWYACDVSKLDEVHRAREAIEEDVGNFFFTSLPFLSPTRPSCITPFYSKTR